MKKISLILMLCMILTSFTYTVNAGIYDQYEAVDGNIATSSLSNVYKTSTVTATIRVDKDSFEKIVAFDFIGSLTNLEVSSVKYLPSQRPSQLITSSTTGSTIDLSGFFLSTETPMSPDGNYFDIIELELKPISTGNAKIDITDAFVKFDFDESFGRRVDIDTVSFTVKSTGGGGPSGSNRDDDDDDDTTVVITPPVVTPPVVTPPADEPQAWINPFEDVTDTDWYFESVKYANINNLMKGVTDTAFSPSTPVTRAMFVTVLYRMEGEPKAEGNTFKDVPQGSYYEKAVAWANKCGIVNGVSSDMFAPDNNITREQMAAIVYRYAAYKKADLSAGENTNILSYEDFNHISEYAIPAFQYMAGEGIMKGETDTTLNPKNISTRAQAATVFMRVMEKIIKNKGM